MAAISYDGHSFTVDGRRIWLISGTIEYARLPRALWADRIHAAKQAGLNCIEAPVCWNLHEPQPGTYRFDGEADLRGFIELLAEAGLWCILRPGPYIGQGYDMGGLPPWLLEGEGVEPGRRPPRRRRRKIDEPEPEGLRQSTPHYLQAVARYLDELMNRLRDLQASEQGVGPIIAVQNEHQWFCHNQAQAEGYLELITRFLRESGCKVPLLNRNNLWQQTPGTIDTWHGDDHAFAHARQMRSLTDDAPCLLHVPPGEGPTLWGEKRQATKLPQTFARRLVEVAAAGAMFNIDPFCGGTNFAFRGGRLSGGDELFLATAYDGDAPVGEAGQRRLRYHLVKRLATFLSSFESLITRLEPQEHHTVATSGLSVVQQSGSIGHVVYLWRDEFYDATTVELATPDGRSLPVDFGDDEAAWIVLDAKLGGAATLDVTNLRPWAFAFGSLLVLFGPAGSEGLVSVDGALYDIEVPTGAEPLVIEGDPVHIVVLNTQQVDAAYLGETALYIGVAGLDADGEPIRHDDFAECHIVTPDASRYATRPDKPKKPSAPKLDAWSYASTDAYVTGKAPRYATLDGPQALEDCGADYGYGWYRLRLPKRRAKKCALMLPEAGDRLHLYVDGKYKAVYGLGPGAKPASKPFTFQLSGETEFVILADNLGRFSEDLLIDQPVGLYGHIVDVKTLRLNKPKLLSEPRIDPFALSAFVPHCRVEEHGPFPRYAFDFNLTQKQPLVLVFSGERPRCVVLINNKPVTIDIGENVTNPVVIDEHLRRGKNRIVLAMIDAVDDPEKYDPRAKHLAAYQVVDAITDGAEWWYARWQLPDDTAFEDVPATPPNQPAFYRALFEVAAADAPLFVELAGVTKGQIYLNGHNVGRYFVASPTGKQRVAPQKRYFLPQPWLLTDGPNELILFDEHGRKPTRTRLVYDPLGPFGD